jgi:hypothetical protein
MRALEDGTSVNALLRAYLERYAGSREAGDALGGFVGLARKSVASSGPGGRTWTRDDVHDRVGLRSEQAPAGPHAAPPAGWGRLRPR